MTAFQLSVFVRLPENDPARLNLGADIRQHVYTLHDPQARTLAEMKPRADDLAQQLQPGGYCALMLTHA